MKKLLISSLIGGLTIFGLTTGPVLAAGSASLSLSPASGNHVVGTSWTVNVLENGDAVNVVTANLSYDASKLTCTGVSGGSAFPNQISGSCSGGSVSISRYTAPGATVSGSQTVASINFTAVAAGSAVVSFASNSQIASAGVNVWNGSTAGGSYTLTAPVTNPTNPTTPTNPTNPSTPSNPTTPVTNHTGTSATTAVTATTANGTKVTTIKNTDGSTTTTSVAKNGETTVVTKTADGKVFVKKVSNDDSRKKHRWYQFGTVDGNTPLSAARYGTVGLVGLSALAGLVYLAMRRRDLLFGKPKSAGKAMVGGVKTAPRALATAVKPLPSKVKKLAKRG